MGVPPYGPFLFNHPELENRMIERIKTIVITALTTAFIIGWGMHSSEQQAIERITKVVNVATAQGGSAVPKP